MTSIFKSFPSSFTFLISFFIIYRLKMRTRNFIKYWSALLSASLVFLGYVFYTFNVKTYRGNQSSLKKEQSTYIQIPSLRVPRKGIIIFGQDRSGTTFISAMFANDPQIFMVYEPLWITQRWFFLRKPVLSSLHKLRTSSSKFHYGL